MSELSGIQQIHKWATELEHEAEEVCVGLREVDTLLAEKNGVWDNTDEDLHYLMLGHIQNMAQQVKGLTQLIAEMTGPIES